MHRTRKFATWAALISCAVLLAGGRTARATIPITLDVSDGYTFSGVQRPSTSSGVTQMPLGNLFSNVPTQIELRFLTDISGNVRAVFPGQGPGTILVDTGARCCSRASSTEFRSRFG